MINDARRLGQVLKTTGETYTIGSLVDIGSNLMLSAENVDVEHMKRLITDVGCLLETEMTRYASATGSQIGGGEDGKDEPAPFTCFNRG